MKRRKHDFKIWCKNNWKTWVKHIIITLIIIFFTFPLEFVLWKYLDMHDENLFLIFVVAVIIVLIETKNILYGIFSSLAFVLAFNWFQVDPTGSFQIKDGSYYVSFSIFLVVVLIVGSLVMKLQKQNKLTSDNARKVRAMYDLSSKLLDSHDHSYVLNFVVRFFTEYLDMPFTIIDTDNIIYGAMVSKEEAEPMMQYCLEKNIVIGKGTFMYKESDYLCFPIRSKSNVFGCLFVNMNDKNLSESSIEFIKKNLLHAVVVLDREKAIALQEDSKVEIEKEKFKTSLLRSLSHDLKTPLTSIQSGSDLILNSYDKLDDDTIKSIVSDIYHDSIELNSFIVNLLNMSKLDEMKYIINRKNESVDDILSEVYSKSAKILNGKELEIVPSKKMTFVNTDAVLLETVFVNLIDNAVKHTKKDTKISITYKSDKDGVIFNVVDNGGGIDKQALSKIFDDFYSLTNKEDKSRCNGLGLSICKAIVEAHGGKIAAKNNEIGGATFTFNIPNVKEAK